jgi:hypothetical protein
LLTAVAGHHRARTSTLVFLCEHHFLPSSTSFSLHLLSCNLCSISDRAAARSCPGTRTSSAFSSLFSQHARTLVVCCGVQLMQRSIVPQPAS